jgi:hypothetical protein
LEGAHLSPAPFGFLLIRLLIPVWVNIIWIISIIQEELLVHDGPLGDADSGRHQTIEAIPNKAWLLMIHIRYVWDKFRRPVISVSRELH